VQKPQGKRIIFRERVDEVEMLDISSALRGWEGHFMQKSLSSKCLMLI